MTAPAAVSPVARSLAAGPDRVAYRAPRPSVAFQGAGRATPAARLDTLTEHPPVPPGRDLGGEVRQALAGYSLRAGGGILPPRPARDCCANRPSLLPVRGNRHEMADSIRCRNCGMFFCICEEVAA